MTEDMEAGGFITLNRKCRCILMFISYHSGAKLLWIKGKFYDVACYRFSSNKFTYLLLVVMHLKKLWATSHLIQDVHKTNIALVSTIGCMGGGSQVLGCSLGRGCTVDLV